MLPPPPQADNMAAVIKPSKGVRRYLNFIMGKLSEFAHHASESQNRMKRKPFTDNLDKLT